jgi:dienelactone hydrolase
VDTDALKNQLDERNTRYRRELEDWFRSWIVDGYAERAGTLWKRDYSSVEAYERSVQPNRERWRAILNPPDLRISGPPESEPVGGLEGLDARYVRLPLGERLRAEAILAIPKSKGPVPLIVSQHGIGSQPEHVFGLIDPEGVYHSYARRLVEAGFAVLAPMNLFGGPPRGRIVRMATLAGTTLPGIELVRMQRLLDVVLQQPEIDSEKVGFWGLSLGGMAAQLWGPLEPRLRAIISAAWFNSRLAKMVIPDPRYSCFLDVQEEHVFIRGWLTEFCDSDLVSLICPRPFLVQAGKADGIAWWPQLVEEFGDLKRHYHQLGIADRCAIDLHEGGHEVRVENGIAWLKKWL